MTRALIPVKLAPEEVKFMRKAMGMTGRDLAAALNTDPATVSRWETGGQTPGEFVERLLRHLVCEELQARAPGIAYDPSRITRMRVQPAWPADAWPEIEVQRVKLKESGHPIIDAWYHEAKAA